MKVYPFLSTSGLNLCEGLYIRTLLSQILDYIIYHYYNYYYIDYYDDYYDNAMAAAVSFIISRSRKPKVKWTNQMNNDVLEWGLGAWKGCWLPINIKMHFLDYLRVPFLIRLARPSTTKIPTVTAKKASKTPSTKTAAFQQFKQSELCCTSSVSWKWNIKFY